MKSSWGLRAVAVAGVACLVAAGTTVPAQAGKDRVVRGQFTNLEVKPTHPLPQLSGRAQLVRTGSGKTKVSVHVKGLKAGHTYGVHLHDAPCKAANPGGGHYKFDPDGLGEPPNELWASSDRHNPKAGITANRAGIAKGHGTARWTAGPQAQSVVIHISLSHGGTTAGGTKLACADLR